MFYFFMFIIVKEKMNDNCIFAKPFKPMVYEPTELVFESTGINPFEEQFRPVKKEVNYFLLL